MQESAPFISVIVPTYERADQLSVCLSALLAQDYPLDRFELLVVDDGSSTSPESTVAAFRDRLNIRCLTQPHAGPAAARNHGAAHAKGEVLAFTDDDCMPAPGWLRSLANGFRAYSDCVLGGLTVNALTSNMYSTASQLIVDYLYAQWNSDLGRATFFTSNNIALSTRGFRAVGGFDVSWTRAAGEDRDLCDRLVSDGYQLTYVPEALVYHAHPLKFVTFWRQQFNYGRGAYRLHLLRTHRMAGGIHFQAVAFYLQLFGFPFVRERSMKALRIAWLLAIAQAANMVGFFWEWVTGERV